MLITTCQTCLTQFEAHKGELKRGYAKYCSRKCFGRRSTRFKHKEPNTCCAYCNTPFYKSPSKLKLSKSGLHFCSRSHKDQAQRIGGISDIQPDHYGKGISIYRDLALRTQGKHKYCNRCGFYTAPHILQVHHKDRNRKNVELTNLEVLCPNCYEIEHYMKRDGRYTR